MAKYVPFLTVEDSDDLVVSFGLGEHASTSLTLIRTPKYEHLLLEEERGVSVGSGPAGGLEKELLVSVQWGSDLVLIKSTAQSYALNIRAVDPAEIEDAKKVLRKMNHDHRFEVKGD
jgi:hypothetical protein